MQYFTLDYYNYYFGLKIYSPSGGGAACATGPAAAIAHGQAPHLLHSPWHLHPQGKAQMLWWWVPVPGVCPLGNPIPWPLHKQNFVHSLHREESVLMLVGGGGGVLFVGRGGRGEAVLGGGLCVLGKEGGGLCNMRGIKIWFFYMPAVNMLLGVDRGVGGPGAVGQVGWSKEYKRSWSARASCTQGPGPCWWMCGSPGALRWGGLPLPLLLPPQMVFPLPGALCLPHFLCTGLKKHAPPPGSHRHRLR